MTCRDEWKTANVLALVNQCHENPDVILPMLGDALEEAGCDLLVVLKACRERMPWVLTWIKPSPWTTHFYGTSKELAEGIRLMTQAGSQRLLNLGARNITTETYDDVYRRCSVATLKCEVPHRVYAEMEEISWTRAMPDDLRRMTPIRTREVPGRSFAFSYSISHRELMSVRSIPDLCRLVTLELTERMCRAIEAHNQGGANA